VEPGLPAAAKVLAYGRRKLVGGNPFLPPFVPPPRSPLEARLRSILGPTLPAPGRSRELPVKRKLFVSYHHDRDQVYYNEARPSGG